jgi:hypothetical protein
MYNNNGLGKTFKENWDIIMITILAFTTILMIFEYTKTVAFCIKERVDPETGDTINEAYYNATGEYLPTY